MYGESIPDEQLLRDQWGFAGFVVSDLYSIDGLISQRVAASREEAGILALRSGVDSDLGGNCFSTDLVKACREGRLAEADIDRAVSRILRLKFKMGLFDNPYVKVKEGRKADRHARASGGGEGSGSPVCCVAEK